MKKLLICLLALLLLCGCSQTKTQPTAPTGTAPTLSVPTTTEPPTTVPPPVYDETPALTETAVTLHGTAAGECYESDDTLLLALAPFCRKEGFVLSTQQNEDGSFSCTLHRDDTEVHFSNRDAQMTLGGQELTLPCRSLYDGEQWYVPLRPLLDAFEYTEYQDLEQNHLYYTLLPDLEQIPDGYHVPCLMYHAVSDDCWGIEELFVSPAEMDKQLAYLTENGYTPIWFEDLPNIAQIEKPVLLTFDDGYDDNYIELYPLLQKYQCKATIFCIANSFGALHKLTAEQIRELSDSGLVSIQSHTVTHPDLDRQDEATQRWELTQSQLELLRVTGKQPFVLCYPTGRYNSTTISLAREIYSYGILMSGGSLVTGKDPFYVGRSYVSRYTSLSGFAAMLP